MLRKHTTYHADKTKGERGGLWGVRDSFGLNSMCKLGDPRDILECVMGWEVGYNILERCLCVLK